jgi:polar amino acid transport system substrate-binding protein
MTRPRLLIAALLLALAAAGCGASSDHAEREALAALAVQAPAPPPAETKCYHAIPSGSDISRIEQRGHLIVGVDQNTRLLSYWNPRTPGQFTGFEIDLAHRLAQALFGNPKAVKFRAVTTDERIPDVEQNRVDLSIDAITITPKRKCQVAFSTVYLLAHQRLLVRLHSSVHSARDLARRWVCATSGSTSLTTIENAQPRALFDPVQQRTDCLVALEEGWASAVTSDDAILRGFQTQDPLTKIVGPSLAPEPYGIAINRDDPQLVGLVDGVLARMRSDGSLKRLYAHWFSSRQALSTAGAQ